MIYIPQLKFVVSGLVRWMEAARTEKDVQKLGSVPDFPLGTFSAPYISNKFLI
jgi:hypothetical protein